MRFAALIVSSLILLPGCQMPVVESVPESVAAVPARANESFTQTSMSQFLSLTSPPQGAHQPQAHEMTAPPQGLRVEKQLRPETQLSTTSTMTAPPQGVTAPPAGMTAPPQGMTAPPQGVTAPPSGVTSPPMGIQAPLEQSQFEQFDSNHDNHWDKAELGSYRQAWNTQYQSFATQSLIDLEGLLQTFDYNQDGLLNYGEARSLHESQRQSLGSLVKKVTGALL